MCLTGNDLNIVDNLEVSNATQDTCHAFLIYGQVMLMFAFIWPVNNWHTLYISDWDLHEDNTTQGVLWNLIDLK